MMVKQKGFGIGTAIVSLLFLSTLLGLVWIGTGIVAKDRWPIRWLEINGEFERVSAEQIRASLSPMVSSSYFTVDLPGLSSAASNMPWVSRVHVQKQWPDTVSVLVFEYQPVAHWNRDQLISSSGEPFSVPAAEQLQGLPWLQGPDNRLDEVLRQWVDFNDVFVPLGLDIQTLSLDERGAWSLVLSNGAAVSLGREHAKERIRRLVSSWPTLMLDQTRIPKDIDLRYTNGFAVNWMMEEQAGKDS